MAKLQKERGKDMHVTAAAKKYLRSSEIKNLAWNGREIRNCE
jgi:hypothetical protein